MVSAEEQRVLDLQQQIRETEKAANAPNPASGYDPSFVSGVGKDTTIGKEYQTWQESTRQAKEKLPELKSQLSQLTSSSPSLTAYAEKHPATQYEIQSAGESMFGGSIYRDVQVNHAYVPSTDKQKYERLKSFAEQNPNASIQDVISLYQESPLPQGNATVDYEATIALAQQTGVHMPLSSGLAETYEKDQQKRYEAIAPKHYVLNLGYTGGNLAKMPAMTGTPSTAPVNPRKKTQTGDKTRLFGNPSYVPYSEQKDILEFAKESTATPKDAKNVHYFLSLEEGGFQKPEPKQLAISLTEGTPKKPRKLTQEQVNRLSPQEYAVYQAEYAAYNQYVKQKNAEIKKENTKALKDYQTSVLSIIQSAKEKGATRIRITDEQGNVITTTPLERAFYDISKQRNKNVFLIPAGEPERQLTGISQGPGGELTQTYTEGERFKTGVFIPQKTVQKTGEVEVSTPITELSMARQQTAEEESRRPQDPLSKSLREINVMEGSRYRDVKIASSVISNIGSQFGGLVNLSNMAGKFITEKITGVKPLAQDVAIPESAPGSFVDVGIYGGAEQAIRTKNPKAFPSRLADAGSGYYKSLEKDPYRTLAETGGFLTPILPLPTPGLGQAKTFVGKVAGFLKGAKPILSFKTIEEPLLQVRYRPTNPMRETVSGPELTRPDIATPFSREGISLGKTEIQMGRTKPSSGPLHEQIIVDVVPDRTIRRPAPDAFYQPRVEVRRAPEPNTFRVDEKALFGRDTSGAFKETTVNIGEKTPIKNVRYGQVMEKQTVELGESKTILKKQTVDLGEGKIKNVRYGQVMEKQTVDLGEGNVIAKRQSVPLGESRYAKRINRPGFERTRIDLGQAKILGFTQQSINIGEKTPIKIGGGLYGTKIGLGENWAEIVKGKINLIKGTKNRFDQTQIKIEGGLGRKGKLEKSRGPLAAQEGNIIKYSDEIERNAKAVPKKEYKLGKENPPKPVSKKEPEIPSGKGTVQILKPEQKLQSVTENISEKGTGFTKTTVGLGEGKGIAIATGGIAVAPLPLLVRGEDQGTPITNGTQTNATEIISPEPDLTGTVSVLEPASITESRPSTVGAILAGTAYDLYQGVNPKTRTALGLETKSVQVEREKTKQKTKSPIILSYAEVAGLRQPLKERQRLETPFPWPSAQPQRLVQPEAFKEKEKLKLLEIPPEQPPRQRTILDIPFAEKKKEKTKREKKEEKEKIEFIGNVFEEQVTGGFRKFDIKYGAKKVRKQEAVQLAIGRRGRKPFAGSSKAEPFLKSKQNYFTEKKPKVITKSGFARPGKKFRF